MGEIRSKRRELTKDQLETTQALPPPPPVDMIMRSGYNGATVQAVVYTGEATRLTWELQHSLCAAAGRATPGSDLSGWTISLCTVVAMTAWTRSARTRRPTITWWRTAAAGSTRSSRTSPAPSAAAWATCARAAVAAGATAAPRCGSRGPPRLATSPRRRSTGPFWPIFLAFSSVLPELAPSTQPVYPAPSPRCGQTQ
eukprot:COSAG04_NODE_1591_length_6214_cov_29.260095_6_plen_198_part_00